MPEEKKLRSTKEIISVLGHPSELVTVFDKKGKVLHKMIKPVMVRFYPRDVMQVIVGASILAIPVAFTEETWRLGETLPLQNVLGLLFVSLVFISSFVYYNYYRGQMKRHWPEFVKRVVVTYFVSFLVVSALLTLIQRAPWDSAPLVAFSRAAIVSFPASMSASVADMIK